MMAAGASDSGTTVKRVDANGCKSWQVGNGTRAMEVHPGLKLAEVSSHCHCWLHKWLQASKPPMFVAACVKFPWRMQISEVAKNEVSAHETLHGVSYCRNNYHTSPIHPDPLPWRCSRSTFPWPGRDHGTRKSGPRKVPNVSNHCTGVA